MQFEENALMATYLIDTAETLKSLVASGMPEPQAEAVVKVLSQGHGDLVTKTDLKASLNELESRLTLKIYLMAGLVIAGLKILEYLGI